MRKSHNGFIQKKASTLQNFATLVQQRDTIDVLASNTRIAGVLVIDMIHWVIANQKIIHMLLSKQRIKKERGAIFTAGRYNIVLSPQLRAAILVVITIQYCIYNKVVLMNSISRLLADQREMRCRLSSPIRDWMGQQPDLCDCALIEDL